MRTFKFTLEGGDRNKNGRPDITVTASAFGFTFLNKTTDIDLGDMMDLFGGLVEQTRKVLKL